MGTPPPHLNKHNNQPMVNWWFGAWWFGLVVWVGGLDSWDSLMKSMCYFPMKIPDHQPKPPIWSNLPLPATRTKKNTSWSPVFAISLSCGRPNWSWQRVMVPEVVFWAWEKKNTLVARWFMLCSKMGNLICVKKIRKRNKQKWMLFPRTMTKSAN